jgi:hypothetical protein
VFENKVQRRICGPGRRNNGRFIIYTLHHTFLSFPMALHVLENLGRFLMEGFEIVFSAVGRTPWANDGPSQGLYLHRTAQHKKTRINIHALSGIRTHHPSIRPVKTLALDLAANVIGH